MKHALIFATSLAFVLSSQIAFARRNGIAASSCDGCHGAIGATATITSSPASLMPGADATISVAISRMAGATSVGGIFVPAPEVGSLSAIAGEGLTLSNNNLVHSAPKAAQNGVVTFRFGYRAPATPGALNLNVFVLSANGDGRTSGDQAGSGSFHATFGCAAREYFYDGDGDGFGRKDTPSVVGCDGQAPQNTSPFSTDCDDNDQAIFPGATEVCNNRDDNCDSQVDEGSSPTNLYPDEDGDGFYGANPGSPMVGCGLRGYASRGGDCAPKDPKIHPGVTEICNLLDDNCDGRADERVRPRCGIGRCERESVTCEAADCVPGTPVAETCNLLDDDCDGEVDEGDLCPAGQTCSLGTCSAGGAATGGTGAVSSGGATSASGGSNAAGHATETGGSSQQGGATSAGGASAAGGANAGGTANLSSGGSGVGGSGSGSSPAPSSDSAGCRAARARPSVLGVGAALLPFALLALARRRIGRRASKPTR